MARRYEFYVLVARTISHSFASLTREILYYFYYMETKYGIFPILLCFKVVKFYKYGWAL